MSAESTIALRVQQLGAEGVRTRLREINDELRMGKPVTKDLRTEVSELSNQVRTQDRVVRLQSQAWIENHRTLQTTQRVMSAVGSVARNVLSSVTAISVAVLAFGTKGSDLAQAEADLARAHRDLVAAMESGDPEKISEAQENVNIFTERIKELKDQKLQETASSILSIGASMALMGSSAITAATKLGPMILGSAILGPTLAGLGAAAWVAAIPLAIIAGIVAGVAAAFYMVLTPGDQVAEFFKHFFPEASEQIDQFSRDVDDVFTMHIPNAFIFMANKAMEIFDMIVFGAQDMVNSIIRTINRIIGAYNSLPKELQLFGHIDVIPMADFSGITGNRINYLQSRNQTPAISASVTRTGSGASASPVSPVVNITINGDVSGEELVDKVMKDFKDRLRGSGFTGF